MNSKHIVLPEWADVELSTTLTRICLAGESQFVEFKRSIPPQVRDLAVEIAAFASSNDGLLLIGVCDDGTLVGIERAQEVKVRDKFIERMTGICRAIKPPVHPQFVWAVGEAGLVALGIRVQRGDQPLYYSNERPYVRRATSSRPAGPDEVIDAVRRYLATQGTAAAPSSVSAELISALAMILARTMRWADLDLNLRSLRPWFEESRQFAAHAAATLRDLAADDTALELDLLVSLQTLAEKLEAICAHQPTFGGGAAIDATWIAARTVASTMMETVVKPSPLSAETQAEIKRSITKTARKLADHWHRAKKDIFSDLVEAGRKDFGSDGRRLMDWSYFDFGFLTPDRALMLRAVGARLIKLEARTMYGDGGQSQRDAVAEGMDCARLLTELQLQLEQ